MSQVRPVQRGSPAGLTAVVAGIVSSLPKNRVSAPSGAWHWAFLQLRERHKDRFPELGQLEFLRSPGSWPVSERLERIFQVVDMAGGGSTLNPALVVRQFDKSQKQKLKAVLASRLGGRQAAIAALGRELQELLDSAPARTPNP